MRLLLSILICLLPSLALAVDIHVSAAASLREFATQAANQFEASHPQHRVLLTTASSGTLARQIVAGAPADIFLSANPAWVDYLVDSGKVEAERALLFAANKLIVVGRGQTLSGINELAQLERLATANPKTAPAGRYAMQMLASAGLRDTFAEGRRLVFAKDVRQALLYAEQGAVPAAIIYASDARLLKNTRVLVKPDGGLQPDIRYPIALTRAGEGNHAAGKLFDWLTSDSGASLLKDYGLQCLLGTECKS